MPARIRSFVPSFQYETPRMGWVPLGPESKRHSSLPVAASRAKIFWLLVAAYSTGPMTMGVVSIWPCSPVSNCHATWRSFTLARLIWVRGE